MVVGRHQRALADRVSSGGERFRLLSVELQNCPISSICVPQVVSFLCFDTLQYVLTQSDMLFLHSLSSAPGADFEFNRIGIGIKY